VAPRGGNGAIVLSGAADPEPRDAADPVRMCEMQDVRQWPSAVDQPMKDDKPDARIAILGMTTIP
jgi:hypothetical protein